MRAFGRVEPRQGLILGRVAGVAGMGVAGVESQRSPSRWGLRCAATPATHPKIDLDAAPPCQMLAPCAYSAASEQRERFSTNGPAGQPGQGLSALVRTFVCGRKSLYGPQLRILSIEDSAWASAEFVSADNLSGSCNHAKGRPY